MEYPVTRETLTKKGCFVKCSVASIATMAVNHLLETRDAFQDVIVIPRKEILSYMHNFNDNYIPSMVQLHKGLESMVVNFSVVGWEVEFEGTPMTGTWDDLYDDSKYLFK